jgi:hypothetical protein
MKIVHGHSHDQGRGISIQCCVCDKTMRLADCLIDLDGPVGSYYHSACLVEMTEEAASW